MPSLVEGFHPFPTFSPPRS